MGQGEAHEPDSEAAPMTTEEQEKARRLGTERRRWFLVQTLTSGLVLFLASRTGSSAWLWSTVIMAPLGYWVQLALYLALFLVLYSLAFLPISYYGGYMVQRRYGLSRQRPREWLVDWAKGSLLGVVLGLVASWSFYFIAQTFPGDWWWIYAALLAGGVVLLTYITPYVIVPLFFQMRPLEDQALAERIRQLAERAGTRVAMVCSLDFSRRTAEGNAAVMGFGSSHRVVLADTLLHTFPPRDVEAVVAHELGHHVHGDIWIGMGLQAATIFIGLALAGRLLQPALDALGAGPLTGAPAFPAILLLGLAYSMVAMPFLNAVSRALEWRADLFAIRLTGRPQDFANAMRRLAKQNLIEYRPPRWVELLLATHPPIYRRIALAEAESR